MTARVVIDATALEPMVTYGTNPGMGVPVSGCVPDPAAVSDANQQSHRWKNRWLIWVCARASRCSGRRSMWCLSARAPTAAWPICAPPPRILKGRKVSPGTRVLVVPGSQDVKRQAEAEGLARSLPRSRGRMARTGLLDVHRHERRPARTRPVRRQHLQPQF